MQNLLNKRWLRWFGGLVIEMRACLLSLPYSVCGAPPVSSAIPPVILICVSSSLVRRVPRSLAKQYSGCAYEGVAGWVNL